MADPHWLEVSLTVNGELAEAVAEVLDRYASNGVVYESGVVYNDAEDEGTPNGPVRVYAYLPVDEYLEEKRQRLSEALWYLGRIQPLPEPAYRTIEDEDWMSAWKVHYHPIPIGQRLFDNMYGTTKIGDNLKLSLGRQPLVHAGWRVPRRSARVRSARARNAHRQRTAHRVPVHEGEPQPRDER